MDEKEVPACQLECERQRGPCCPEIDPEEGFCCTRSEGHTGPHVACGYGGTHALKVWDQ